jgi:hypothetical protein
MEEKLYLKIGFLLNPNNLPVYNYLSTILAVCFYVRDRASLAITVPKELSNY